MDWSIFIYISILIAFAMPLNTCALYICVTRGRRAFRREWCILLNFILAHLIQSYISLPLLWASIYNGSWILESQKMCQLDAFLMAVCGFEIIFSHTLMSMERYGFLFYFLDYIKRGVENSNNKVNRGLEVGCPVGTGRP